MLLESPWLLHASNFSMPGKVRVRFHDVSTEQHGVYMLHVVVLTLVIRGAVGRCSSFQALSGSNLNCLFVGVWYGRYLMLGSDEEANWKSVAQFSKRDADALPQYEE